MAWPVPWHDKGYSITLIVFREPAVVQSTIGFMLDDLDVTTVDNQDGK
jgi:hypothetical protein